MAQPADLDPARLQERFERLIKDHPFSGCIGRSADLDALEVRLAVHLYAHEMLPWEELTGDLDEVLKRAIERAIINLKDKLARLAK